jgi:hypothetical protein
MSVVHVAWGFFSMRPGREDMQHEPVLEALLDIPLTGA